MLWPNAGVTGQAQSVWRIHWLSRDLISQRFSVGGSSCRSTCRNTSQATRALTGPVQSLRSTNGPASQDLRAWAGAASN
jgi:hypothetical protein